MVAIPFFTLDRWLFLIIMGIICLKLRFLSVLDLLIPDSEQRFNGLYGMLMFLSPVGLTTTNSAALGKGTNLWIWFIVGFGFVVEGAEGEVELLRFHI